MDDVIRMRAIKLRAASVASCCLLVVGCGRSNDGTQHAVSASTFGADRTVELVTERIPARPGQVDFLAAPQGNETTIPIASVLDGLRKNTYIAKYMGDTSSLRVQFGRYTDPANTSTTDAPVDLPAYLLSGLTSHTCSPSGPAKTAASPTTRPGVYTCFLTLIVDARSGALVVSSESGRPDR